MISFHQSPLATVKKLLCQIATTNPHNSQARHELNLYTYITLIDLNFTMIHLLSEFYTVYLVKWQARHRGKLVKWRFHNFQDIPDLLGFSKYCSSHISLIFTLSKRFICSYLFWPFSNLNLYIENTMWLNPQNCKSELTW